MARDEQRSFTTEQRVCRDRRHRRKGGRRSTDPAPQRPLVLIADDDSLHREAAEALLSKWGCGVIEASDGQTAVDKAISFKPDVIILDMLLPVLAGNEAARRMKTTAETCTIPIIAVTPTDHHRTLALEAACDTFIDDYSAEALLLALRRFMNVQFTA